ncbi:YegS/Rv2252/BmrU family lipid kinase [Aeromicrobium sp. CnD17-E]|uniref:YegS/Rv2252/BmrU family lipid kinase n=1 Tax=Aeromicrobium sp. CnD17-E TaxID=2954487 RepID=UPI00209691B7|nr:YegS/Rv2252/BmrU family lipid kinase [Aeromicrobium sp. CnD17-E]MCO7238754.1 YegS/Rv2252/BmrU family lipid kinase [Aeromicrobium sp. CnD17-E]
MLVTLVVNPVSGRRQGERIAAAATARLTGAGHRVARIHSSDGAQAREAVAREVAAGAELVLVVGGDGLLHDVLPAVAERDVTVGLLPAGTGNDTARALGLPVGDPDAALDVVLRGRTRAVDLASTDRGHVVTVVASGFDSKVNERANAMRWPRGNQRYNLAILAELRTFQPLPFSLDLDGTRVDTEAMLVAVGNGPSFGGGLRIAEGAVMDDGLLDVCVIRPVSKARLVRVFPQLYRGTHVDLPEFERHRVRRVHLACPDVVAYGDGERLGPLPLTVTVLERALRVLVP